MFYAFKPHVFATLPDLASLGTDTPEGDHRRRAAWTIIHEGRAALVRHVDATLDVARRVLGSSEPHPDFRLLHDRLPPDAEEACTGFARLVRLEARERAMDSPQAVAATLQRLLACEPRHWHPGRGTARKEAPPLHVLTDIVRDILTPGHMDEAVAWYRRLAHGMREAALSLRRIETPSRLIGGDSILTDDGHGRDIAMMEELARRFLAAEAERAQILKWLAATEGQDHLRLVPAPGDPAGLAPNRRFRPPLPPDHAAHGGVRPGGRTRAVPHAVGPEDAPAIRAAIAALRASLESDVCFEATSLRKALIALHRAADRRLERAIAALAGVADIWGLGRAGAEIATPVRRFLNASALMSWPEVVPELRVAWSWIHTDAGLPDFRWPKEHKAWVEAGGAPLPPRLDHLLVARGLMDEGRATVRREQQADTPHVRT